MVGVQFKHLAHAVSPVIYGHELLKAGILLALLGGVRKVRVPSAHPHLSCWMSTILRGLCLPCACIWRL